MGANPTEVLLVYTELAENRSDNLGYMTYINLTIENSDITLEEVAETIGEITREADTPYWVSVLSGQEDTRWSDIEDEMKQVSALHPDALITLNGMGEENGDQWVEYHRNGLVQIERMPEWTPPPFDPAKLK